MPTVTKYSPETRWGNSAYNSSTSAFNVGLTGAGTNYWGRAEFTEIDKTWNIKSIKLLMRRTDDYSTHTLQIGGMESGAWDTHGSRDFSKNFAVSSGQNWKTFDLTAYKDIIQSYVGSWYIHVDHGSGSNSYTEFYGSAGNGPKLVIEYEESHLEVPGGALEFGVSTNITIGTVGDGMTHTLSAKYVGTDGTGLLGITGPGAVDVLIAENVPGGTVVSWTPPVEWGIFTPNTMSTMLRFFHEFDASGGMTLMVVDYPIIVPATWTPTINGGSTAFALSNPVGDSIGIYVQGRSRSVCTIDATPAYDAPIINYKLTIGGKTYESASNQITTDILTVTGALTATIEIEDSRGQKAMLERSAAVTVHPYTAPHVTALSVMRCLSDGTPSNDGTFLKFTLGCAFSALFNLNDRLGSVRYMAEGGAWSAPVSLDATMSALAAGVYGFTLTGVIGGSIGSGRYTVEATLTDRYNSTADETGLASRKIWFDRHGSGSGMAYGGTAVTPDIQDFYQPARLRAGLAPQMTDAEVSALLARLMPSCILYNPAADTISYSATYRSWLCNFQSISRNDNGAFGILLGGAAPASRKMGWIIPVAGLYRVEWVIRGNNGGGPTDLCVGIARFKPAWNPPAANYITRDALFADVNLEASTLHYINRLTTSTGDQVSGNTMWEFAANAGDKIWPWVAPMANTKQIQAGDTYASIQKIG